MKEEEYIGIKVSTHVHVPLRMNQIKMFVQHLMLTGKYYHAN